MKTLQISFVFGFLLVLFSVVAKGFHFYGPYDVYRSRAARYQSPRVAIRTVERGNDNDNGFPNTADSEQDYYKIISYLDRVGRRRR
ncbi:hypothetical protein BsWGS_06540 [Bradybaena similaris]